MSKDISESDKLILAGRIYPAIQSCVSNRYKIVVGYFAIVGYVVFDKAKLEVFVNSGSSVFIAIIFTFFAIHNTINYWINSKEQWGREHINKKFPLVELLSSFTIIILIWSGYVFLKKYSCKG